MDNLPYWDIRADSKQYVVYFGNVGFSDHFFCNDIPPAERLKKFCEKMLPQCSLGYGITFIDIYKIAEERRFESLRETQNG